MSHPWGVNVVGHLRAELGLGQVARGLIAALDERGIPRTAIDRPLEDTRSEHPFDCVTAPAHGSHAVNVICENAATTARCAEVMGEGFFAGRRTAGMWFWEVSAFPDLWDDAFGPLDEVWVASEHVGAAVRSRSPIPVVKLPLAIAPEPSVTLSREELGLPDGFLFVFVFDHNSILERKNPLGLIEAFSRAFAPGSGAALTIKAINGDRRPEDRDRLRAAAAGHPDVRLIERFHSSAEQDALIAQCDCYVSLHRAEGFGLTLAEAMWVGRPVIATGYSGNLEFTTPENSWLVDHGMGAIGPGREPYPPDGRWAEPDLEHAARLMREVRAHPDEAARKARRARDDIRRWHSVAAASEAIEARLEALAGGTARRPWPFKT